MVVRILLAVVLSALCSLQGYAAEQTDIGFVVQHDKPSVWTRQQYRVWIEVETADKFASLQANELVIPGFTIVPMTPSRQQAENGKPTRLQAGWLLYANRSGVFDITPPSIEYLRGGKVQRQFSMPAIKLNVRPLPPYVPPTMPVGKITLDSNFIASSLLRQDSLYQWKIVLQSAENPPNSFTPVLRQLKQANEFIFFPAETNRQSNPGVNGIHSTVTHNIPFKPLVNGIFSLPKLRIQYFDPHSGKIITHYYKTATVLSLNLLLWILSVLFAVFAGYKVIKLLFAYAQTRYEKSKAVSAATLAIIDASTADDLRMALRAYAFAKGWEHNTALSQWPARWPIKSAMATRFKQASSSLSLLCFSATYDDMDFVSIKKCIAESLSISY